MHILPVSTGLLQHGDDLARAIVESVTLKDDDIIVISSKAVTATESGSVDLSPYKPSAEALEYSKVSNQSPVFTQFVLDETKRFGGHVTGTCPYVLLTTLIPKEMRKGCIVCPNAGADQSNVESGRAIGWPEDPVQSVLKLKTAIEKQSGVRIGVLLSDSCCRPSRQGVTALALTVAGFDPIRNEKGKKDLHGNPLNITQEALADQLATAGNFLMGNAAQATPAAVIREHGIPLSDFLGWVDGIEPEDDLFQSMLN